MLGGRHGFEEVGDPPGVVTWDLCSSLGSRYGWKIAS